MITRQICGLAEIADQFDACFIDQFGTLHNGQRVYDGVLEALRWLKANAKRVIVLSNSGRRSAWNQARLAALGIDRGMYEAVICSGEVALQALRHDPPPFLRSHCRVWVVAGTPSLDGLEGFDVELVQDVELADLVFFAGTPGEGADMDAIWGALSAALARGVPALCTNTDRYSLTHAGMCLGPGALADRYRSNGGRVISFGKPYDAVYKAAFDVVSDVEQSRILCIGDSIEHDIAGAASHGCRSLLVHTGINAGSDISSFLAQSRELDRSPQFLMKSLMP